MEAQSIRGADRRRVALTHCGAPSDYGFGQTSRNAARAIGLGARATGRTYTAKYVEPPIIVATVSISIGPPRDEEPRARTYFAGVVPQILIVCCETTRTSRIVSCKLEFEKIAFVCIGRGDLKSMSTSRSSTGGRQNCMKPRIPGDGLQPAGASNRNPSAGLACKAHPLTATASVAARAIRRAERFTTTS
jgi:hypothetical protein